MALPFLVYSDGPRQPTGLARITRDLMTRLWAEREALDLDLLQVGYDPLPGPAVPWPLWTFSQMETGPDGDWGAPVVDQAARQHFQRSEPEGVLFSVWDPGRAYALLGVKALEQRWGYFPIDAANVQGTLSGPAGEAIKRYDRVLAYTHWGSTVLRDLRSPIPYLPHGLDLDTWTYRVDAAALERMEGVFRRRPGEWILGCIATNQPRKDLPIFFGTLAELRRRGHKVKGWLHTDRMVRHWAIPGLIQDFNLGRHVVVTLSLTDQELAAGYASCGVTLAPGLGEGFGYPIVESLGCGTPVVHGDYAGGAELLPLNAWRVPVRAQRVEGFYALVRPVFRAEDFANAVERALDWKRNDHQVVQAYCRGAVDHLSWGHVWPRFRSWIKQGLEEL